MNKYIIVDERYLLPLITPITSYFNISDNKHIKEMIPCLLVDYTEPGINVDFWNYIGLILTEEQFNLLNYDDVGYFVENITEMIQENLNVAFNMCDSTWYSFDKWIGDDIKLVLHQ